MTPILWLTAAGMLWAFFVGLAAGAWVWALVRAP
jgi:hypothetical protein